jgi:hypothetical protein
MAFMSARDARRAGLAVAALAVAGGCVAYWARSPQLPPRPVPLETTAHPLRLAQTVSLGQLDGGISTCPPPVPPADHGLCNVVGTVMTITYVRSASVTLGQGGGYDLVLRVPATEQKALGAFWKRVNSHEIGIALGATPFNALVVSGPQPAGLVTLPLGGNRAQADRLFRRITGVAPSRPG